MLAEYFSLNISSSGHVESIPLLLPDYTPNLDKLPYFLMRLGPQVRHLLFSNFTYYNLIIRTLQVDWETEAECFESFLRELAYFYVPGPGPFGRSSSLEISAESESSQEEASLRDQEVKAERWQIQHALFPGFRRYLVPPKTLLDGGHPAIIQVANLPDLYKVFERC
jgi:DNA mismatch repair protein MLH1